MAGVAIRHIRFAATAVSMPVFRYAATYVSVDVAAAAAFYVDTLPLSAAIIITVTLAYIRDASAVLPTRVLLPLLRRATWLIRAFIDAIDSQRSYGAGALMAAGCRHVAASAITLACWLFHIAAAMLYSY